MIRLPPISTLFPTRRSSDLISPDETAVFDHVTSFNSGVIKAKSMGDVHRRIREYLRGDFPLDRKSTRLNSSHTVISYAVFCLKKKKNKKQKKNKNIDKQ